MIDQLLMLSLGRITAIARCSVLLSIMVCGGLLVMFTSPAKMAELTEMQTGG